MSNKIVFRLIVVVLVTGFVVSSGYSLHRHRKQRAVAAALDKGLKAYEAKEYTQAAIELGKYVGAHPENIDVLLKYSDAQTQRRPQAKGSMQQAFAALEAVLRRQPAHAEAAERLSNWYLMTRSPLEAERIARAWLNADPNNAVAQRQLALALSRQNKTSEALALIQQTVVKHPEDVKAPQLLMRLLLTSATQPEASAPDDSSESATSAPADPVKIDGRLAGFQNMLEDLAARHPEQPGIYFALARFYRLYPDRGRTLERQHALAIEHMEQAEKHAGENLELLIDIAQFWAEIGSADKAAAAFDRAEQIAPDRMDTYVARAQLAFQMEEWDSGAKVADRALKASAGERRADILPLAVEFYAHTDRLSEAAKCREQVQAFDAPSDVLAYLDAVIAGVEGKPSKAIQGFEDAIRRNPNAPKPRLALGRALAVDGVLDRAASCLEEYLRLQRQQGSMLELAEIELIDLYARLGRWEQAVPSALRLEQRAIGTWLSGRSALTSIKIQASAARPGGARPDPRMLRTQQERLARLLKNPAAGQILELQVLQARIIAWSGSVDEAVAELVKTREESAEKIGLTREIIGLLMEANRLDEAGQESVEAIKSSDEDSRVLFEQTLAEIQLARGDTADAIQVLEKAADQAKPDMAVRLRLRLADIWLKQDQVDAAAMVLKQVAEDDRQNIRCRLLLLNLPATNVELDRQQIISQLREIEGESGVNWRLSQAIFWLGSDDWSSRRVQIGSLLKECLQHAPGWIDAVSVLAAYYERCGEPTRAIQSLQDRLAAKPLDETSAVKLRLQLADIASRAELWPQVERALSALPAKADDPALQRAIDEHKLAHAIQTGQVEKARAILEQRMADTKDYRSRLRLAALLQSQATADDASLATRIDLLMEEAERIRPDDIEVIAARVNLLMARSQFDKAVELCTATLASKKTPEVLVLRARAWEAVGNMENAQRDYQKLAGMEGMAERGALMLGRFLYRYHGRDEAIETWRGGVEKTPKSKELRGVLAEALLATGNEQHRSEAQRIIEQRLAEDPLDEAFLLLRADFLLASDPDESALIYDQIIRHSPQAATAFIKSAQLALARKQLDRAATLIDQGLAGSPRHPGLMVLKAGMLMSESPAQALPLARQAASAEPDNETAVLTLAEALARSGAGREAIQHLTAFLARRGTEKAFDTRINLARLHVIGAEFDKAQVLIEQAEALRPQSQQIVNVRLVWLAGQNRWQELAESAGDYLKQHPDNLAVAETAGNLLLNCPKPENRKASLVFFQHLASRRSDSAEAQAVLGMCHFQLGQIQDARSLLERAHGMNPKNLGILNNLAWILCEDLREPKSAERLMAKYILGGADEASLWDTWGVVLYRLGRVVEAEKALDRAMNHPRASRETQHSAAFHLARAIAESDQQRSRTLLDNLLSKGDDMLKLSPSEKMEAEQLREKLSG